MRKSHHRLHRYRFSDRVKCSKMPEPPRRPPRPPDSSDPTLAQAPAGPADGRTEVAAVRTKSIADDEWEELVVPGADDSGEWPALPATPESSAATEQMEANGPPAGPLSEHTAWVPPD